MNKFSTFELFLNSSIGNLAYIKPPKKIDMRANGGPTPILSILSKR